MNYCKLPKLKHWDQALEQVRSPGFKVLADMTEMRAETPAVEALHLAIHQKMMQHGLAKLAAVVSTSAVGTLAGKRMGKETGVVTIAQNFTSLAEAQAWLDS